MQWTKGAAVCQTKLDEAQKFKAHIEESHCTAQLARRGGGPQVAL